jgi:hypothetical protein
VNRPPSAGKRAWGTWSAQYPRFVVSLSNRETPDYTWLMIAR